MKALASSRLARESAERLMARIERYFLFAALFVIVELAFKVHIGG